MKVEFCFYGDEFDPELISKTMNLVPTKTYLKGEHIRGEFYRKDTYWELSTEYEESFDINEQLIKIINQLKDKKIEIIELQKNLSISSKFIVVIKIENNQKPAIYLERRTIHFISEINSEFDVDYYIYS